MHVYVQKSNRTTWPCRSSGVRGSELIHSVAPSSEGMRTLPTMAVVSFGSFAYLDLRDIFMERNADVKRPAFVLAAALAAVAAGAGAGAAPAAAPAACKTAGLDRK